MLHRFSNWLQRRPLGLHLLTLLLVIGPVTGWGNFQAQRPYSDTSPWNTPIGPNPRYDRYSAEMLQTLVDTKTDGAITSDPDQYSYPVYFADAETPRETVQCAQYKCSIVEWGRTQRVRELRDVPIPPLLTASTGSDAQVIIVDTVLGIEYNFWQIRQENDTWMASNGSIYSTLADGAPPEYGSRGAGVPYYAGLIRPWEIDQGRIDHALAFAYPTPADDRCVYPASKTDGRSDMRFAIPEGARIQLDPGLIEADFRRWGLDRTGIIIARALQEYGMYLIDISGRPKIIAENLKDNPYSDRQWSDPDLNLTSTTIAAIPPEAFSILALPDAYWDPEAPAAAHGECIRQPAITTQ